jgi:hypothetical protein
MSIRMAIFSLPLYCHLNFNVMLSPLIPHLRELCAQQKCPACGNNHQVTFFVKGLFISPQFEGNTCDGFKDLVNNLVRTEVRRFINGQPL